MQGSTIPNLSSCLLLEHQTYLAGYIQLWYVVYTLMAPFPFPSHSHFFALCSRLAGMSEGLKIWEGGVSGVIISPSPTLNVEIRFYTDISLARGE